jgi:hypothetical protein
MNAEPCPEKMVKNTHHNKCAQDSVLHMEVRIESFPRVAAHWCRKDSSKQYLEVFLNRERMYLFYVDHCKDTQNNPVSKSVYKEKMIEKNIVFYTSRKDQC